MNENDRFPQGLAAEPDADELRTVWSALERVQAPGGTFGLGSVASADRTDEAWSVLQSRLGLSPAHAAPSAASPGSFARAGSAAASGEGSSGFEGGAGRARLTLVAEAPASEADPELARSLGERLASPRQASPHLKDVRTNRAQLAARPAWWRAAAAVALLLGGATVWQSVPATVSAPAGERVAAGLPDGTQVVLNAGTTLIHRRGFSLLPGVRTSSRTVTLDGEAFFDVATDGRGFEVVAGGARVTVLGTRFNVRARGSADGGAPVVRVEVEEGRVRVTAVATGAGTELVAGQGVRVLPDALALEAETLAPARIGSWRTGGLTVTDEPLTVVTAELSVRFGVVVSLAEGVDGASRVSAYYPSVAGLESVLSDLATQQNLRVRRVAGGWELF